MRRILSAILTLGALCVLGTSACELTDFDCLYCKYVEGLGDKCEPFTCAWPYPSTSNNYDGPNFSSGTYLLERRDGSTNDQIPTVQIDIIEGVPTGSLSSLPKISDDGRIYDLNAWRNGTYSSDDSDLVDAYAPEPAPGQQCCLLTWECWKFMLTHTDYDDLEVWRKTLCCLADFVTPKPWCPNPPSPWGIPFPEPPLCAST